MNNHDFVRAGLLADGRTPLTATISIKPIIMNLFNECEVLDLRPQSMGRGTTMKPNHIRVYNKKGHYSVALWLELQNKLLSAEYKYLSVVMRLGETYIVFSKTDERNGICVGRKNNGLPNLTTYWNSMHLSKFLTQGRQLNKQGYVDIPVKEVISADTECFILQVDKP